MGEIDENSVSKDDEIALEKAKAALSETVRQLRELSDFLADLAKKPIEDAPPTVH